MWQSQNKNFYTRDHWPNTEKNTTFCVSHLGWLHKSTVTVYLIVNNEQYF